MLRIKIFLFSTIISLAIFTIGNTLVFAQPDLKITEVNFNPVGSDKDLEYFEVTNYGDAAYTGDCDTSDYDSGTGEWWDDKADRFLEYVHGNNPRLVSRILCIEEGQFIIPPRGTVVFARTEKSYRSAKCQVFDYSSAVSLNNNPPTTPSPPYSYADSITILDSKDGTQLAYMDYDGTIANGNGNSLHLDPVTDTYFEAPPSVCLPPCIDFEVYDDARWVEKMPGDNGPGDEGNKISAFSKYFQFLDGVLDEVSLAGPDCAGYVYETTYVDATVHISDQIDCFVGPDFKATNVTAINCTSTSASSPTLEFKLMFCAEEESGRTARVVAEYAGDPDVQVDEDGNVVFQRGVFEEGDIILTVDQDGCP